MTADQPGAVTRTPEEALAAIRALCHSTIWILSAKDVRPILDNVRPAQVFEAELVGAQTIDRGALERLLMDTRYSRGNAWTTEKLADAVFALVRPIEGVVLSPEEAQRVLTWRSRPGWPYDAADQAVADRLDAAS